MSVHLYFCCPWFARWLAAIGHWSALINERPAGGAVSAKSGGWRASPLGSRWRKSSCSRSKCPIEILGPGIWILDPYTIRLLGISIKDHLPRSFGPVASDCFCLCFVCLFVFFFSFVCWCVLSERIVATPTKKQHEEVKMLLLLI